MNRLAIKIIVAINHSVEHTLKQVKHGFFYLPVIFFWLTISFVYVGHLSMDDDFKFSEVSQVMDEGWQLLEPAFRGLPSVFFVKIHQDAINQRGIK